MLNFHFQEESIGYQSSIEKGFDVLGQKHGIHDQSSHGRGGFPYEQAKKSLLIETRQIAKRYGFKEVKDVLRNKDSIWFEGQSNNNVVLESSLKKSGYKQISVNEDASNVLGRSKSGHLYLKRIKAKDGEMRAYARVGFLEGGRGYFAFGIG